MRRSAPATVLAATLLLAGCPAPAPRSGPAGTAVAPPPSGSAPNVPVPPSSSPLPRSPPPPPLRANHLSPATRSLVNQAHGLMTRGDLDGASATLDRALRIEPNNPLVWVEVGRLRLAENEPHQAETTARKALALASGDRGAQGQAGRVLVDALRAQRRNQEANEIEHQPYMR